MTPGDLSDMGGRGRGGGRFSGPGNQSDLGFHRANIPFNCICGQLQAECHGNMEPLQYHGQDTVYYPGAC